MASSSKPRSSPARADGLKFKLNLIPGRRASESLAAAGSLSQRPRGQSRCQWLRVSLTRTRTQTVNFKLTPSRKLFELEAQPDSVSQSGESVAGPGPAASPGNRAESESDSVSLRLP